MRSNAAISVPKCLSAKSPKKKRSGGTLAQPALAQLGRHYLGHERRQAGLRDRARGVLSSGVSAERITNARGDVITAALERPAHEAEGELGVALLVPSD